jgi:hypothetical protein
MTGEVSLRYRLSSIPSYQCPGLETGVSVQAPRAPFDWSPQLKKEWYGSLEKGNIAGADAVVDGLHVLGPQLGLVMVVTGTGKRPLGRWLPVCSWQMYRFVDGLDTPMILRD